MDHDMPIKPDPDPDKGRGIYEKFTVKRNDKYAAVRHRAKNPDGRECRFFVLDIDHDPLALAALEVYAYAAHATGFGALCDDLIAIIKEVREVKNANGIR